MKDKVLKEQLENAALKLRCQELEKLLAHKSLYNLKKKAPPKKVLKFEGDELDYWRVKQ